MWLYVSLPECYVWADNYQMVNLTLQMLIISNMLVALVLEHNGFGAIFPMIFMCHHNVLML